MKTRGRENSIKNLSILLGLFLALFSQACSLKQKSSSSGDAVKVRLALPKKGASSSLKKSFVNDSGSSSSIVFDNTQFPPADIGGFNCFVVNVTGPGINDIFGRSKDDYKAQWGEGLADSCSYPGILSRFMSAGEESVDLDVPVGENRKFQIIGFKLVNPDAPCPTFHPKEMFRIDGDNEDLVSQFLGALEVGAVTQSVSQDSDVYIHNSYDRANPRDVACHLGDGPSGGGAQGMSGGGQNGIAYDHFFVEQARFFDTGQNLKINFHGNLFSTTGNSIDLASTLSFSLGAQQIKNLPYGASSYSLTASITDRVDFGTQVEVPKYYLPSQNTSKEGAIDIASSDNARSVSIPFGVKNLGSVGFVASFGNASSVAGSVEVSLQNNTEPNLAYSKIRPDYVMPSPGQNSDSLVVLRSNDSPCAFSENNSGEWPVPLPSSTPSNVCRFQIFNTANAAVSGLINLRLYKENTDGVYQVPFTVQNSLASEDLIYYLPKVYFLKGFANGGSMPPVKLMSQMARYDAATTVNYDALSVFFKQILIQSVEQHQSYELTSYSVNNSVPVNACPASNSGSSSLPASASGACTVGVSLDSTSSAQLRSLPSASSVKNGVFRFALQKSADISSGLKIYRSDYRVSDRNFDLAVGFNGNTLTIVATYPDGRDVSSGQLLPIKKDGQDFDSRTVTGVIGAKKQISFSRSSGPTMLPGTYDFYLKIDGLDEYFSFTVPGAL